MMCDFSAMTGALGFAEGALAVVAITLVAALIANPNPFTSAPFGIPFAVAALFSLPAIAAAHQIYAMLGTPGCMPPRCANQSMLAIGAMLTLTISVSVLSGLLLAASIAAPFPIVGGIFMAVCSIPLIATGASLITAVEAIKALMDCANAPEPEFFWVARTGAWVVGSLLVAAGLALGWYGNAVAKIPVPGPKPG
jgi:hypothetical protein